jgi:hypothetical protein
VPAELDAGTERFGCGDNTADAGAQIIPVRVMES